MSADLDTLKSNLKQAFGEQIHLVDGLGELTLEVKAADLLTVMRRLRDEVAFSFEQLIDLCGVDYSAYGSDRSEEGRYPANPDYHGPRFAVVYHLLSVSLNQRLRVRVFAEDDTMPQLDSVISIWSSANWYEREAFDLYGILFTGHPDLRRILTDYGFVGNPFRKDFPLSGTVEMRYDGEQRRVVYEPVSIEPREITPRSLREEGYARH
ncbi:MAG: NADH-quinone oxidoreductase subunit C [Sideroxydans sp.]